MQWRHLFFGPDTACRYLAGQVCLHLQIGYSKWCVPSSVWSCSWLGVTFQSLNIIKWCLKTVYM